MRSSHRPSLAVHARRSGIPAAALIAVVAVPAPGQISPLWISQFGTTAFDSADAVSSDGAGGALVAGRVRGSFGGAHAGDSDAFIARFDGAGARLWARQFGSSEEDGAGGVLADAAGGAFVAGWTWGILAAPKIGPRDAWLARLDAAGDTLWLRQFGTNASDTAGALAPDGAGGVFVAGSTQGELGGPRAGGWDAWFGRFDSAGATVWLRQYGGAFDDFGGAIASDGAGGAFVAGSSFTLPGFGDRDAWLARYDRDGNRLWIRFISTAAFDWATAVAPDSAGGAYVVGVTEGSLAAPTAGGPDVWIARFDSEGTQLWVRQFGSDAGDEPRGAAADVSGCFVAGLTRGSLAGPFAGGLEDAFVARYDNDGEQLWAHQFGTSSLDQILAAASDNAGGALLAGRTEGVLAPPRIGGSDAILARFPPADTCYADCDGSGDLTFFDFLCFQNLFAAGDPAADCDGDGDLTFFDFLCFQNAFAAGCP